MLENDAVRFLGLPSWCVRVCVCAPEMPMRTRGRLRRSRRRRSRPSCSCFLGIVSFLVGRLPCPLALSGRGFAASRSHRARSGLAWALGLLRAFAAGETTSSSSPAISAPDAPASGREACLLA